MAAVDESCRVQIFLLNYLMFELKINVKYKVIYVYSNYFMYLNKKFI